MDARIKSGHAENCCEIDMRHDRFEAIISGANPIPPGAVRRRIVAGRGRLRTWIWATPHAGTFARAGY
jgi:hypothetical protein